MWTCLIPTDTPTFLDIANCVFIIAFGSVAFAAVFGIAIFAWMAWKFNLPIHAALPMGIGLVAVLSVLYGDIEWLYWSGFTVIFILLGLGLAKRLKII